MRTDKKEEMNQLEKVKNITVKNLNITLKKEIVYHHLDKLIEVIHWVFPQLTLEKNSLEFQCVALIVTLKK